MCSGVEPEPATTRVGIASASAPKIISGRLWAIMARPHVGAGGRQLKTLPSGAVTRIGARHPALFGTAGSKATLMAYVVYAMVNGNVMLTASSTSPLEPV
jgi:hypothetical protein